jgi:hypothetical protein
MPHATKLQEAVRRRRAAGGPAEDTFAALVGLELRPRRLRDAATLWGALRSAQGTEARERVWSHPDLMPTAEDLDDPLGFSAGARGDVSAVTDEEFDAALAQLLETGDRSDDESDGESGGESDGESDGESGGESGDDSGDESDGDGGTAPR